MDTREHWQKIYRTRAFDRRSWTRKHLDLSLELIRRCDLPRDAAIVDVGGGASTLVDDLLDRNYTNVRVLDISGAALREAKRRLGDRASSVVWIEGDITKKELGGNSVDLWHDRAVFHFLTEAADRAAYLHNVSRSVKRDGFLVIATFAPDGPKECSGLPVMRYGTAALAELFRDFRLLDAAEELHVTPSGGVQKFTYVRMQRRSGGPGAC